MWMFPVRLTEKKLLKRVKKMGLECEELAIVEIMDGKLEEVEKR